jgi:hypothetical protein
MCVNWLTIEETKKKPCTVFEGDSHSKVQHFMEKMSF